MRSRVNGKRLSRGKRVAAIVIATGTGVTVVVAAALYGASLLTAQPRIATVAGAKSLAVASIGPAGLTAVIISTSNSNDCRGYQLNVATGERGDKGRVDCNTGNKKPGRLETISQSFRNR
jgi:hypothetical protein